MKSLAVFIMSGRWQAVLVASGFALLGLLLPIISMLASLISGAAVALVTLRLGMWASAQVMAFATIVLMAAALLLFGQPQAGLLLGMTFWLPVWLLAGVLRRTVDLRTTLLGALAMGAVAIVGLHLAIPDLTARWRELLETLLVPLQQEGMAGADQLRQAFDQIARVMTGILLSGAVLGLILTLFLARAWQAQLYNPGGFKVELYQLQFGRAPALLVLLLLGLAAFLTSYISLELALIILTGLFVQGIVLVHALNEQMGFSNGWLLVFYFFLLIAFPQVSALLAAIGLIDCFADLRQRLGPKSGGGNNSG